MKSAGRTTSKDAPGVRWTAPWLTPDLTFRRQDAKKKKDKKRGHNNRQQPPRRSSDSSASWGTPTSGGGGGGGGRDPPGSYHPSGGKGGTLLLRRPRNPPILTVILIKLDGCLSRYCSELSKPTPGNAARAARLLDECIATGPLPPPPLRPAATSPSAAYACNYSASSSDGSPSPTRGPSVRSPPPQASLGPPSWSPPAGTGTGGGGSLDSSPVSRSTPNSPVSSKRISGGSSWAKRVVGIAPPAAFPSSSSSSSSAAFEYDESYRAALESEWDRFAGPLTLLAGAEALYGGLEHVASDEEKNETKKQQRQWRRRSPSPPPRRRTQPRPVAAAAAKQQQRQRQRSRIKIGSMKNLSPARRPSAANGGGGGGATEYGTGTNNNDSSINNRHHGGSSSSAASASAAAAKILGVYGKVRDDLIIVREILCDPILGWDFGSGRGGNSGSGGNADDIDGDVLRAPAQAGGVERRQQQPHQSEAYRSATSLAASISVLVKLVDARKELISIHSDLLVRLSSSPTESTADAVDGCDDAGGDAGGAGVGVGGDAVPPSHLSELAGRCDALLAALPRVGDNDGEGGTTPRAPSPPSGEGSDRCYRGSALPMMSALRHETGALSAALKAAEHLKRCRFFDTVIHIKRLKLHLSPSSPFYSEPPSSLQMWLRSMLTGLLSCMSLYFDRIDAFASSTYGFQKHIFVEDRGINNGNVETVAAAGGGGSPGSVSPPPSPRSRRPRNMNWYGAVKNYDSEVCSFLHRHEDKHGPPLAVAIVLDAETGSRPDFERGFVYADGAEAGVSPDCVDGLKSFPAIFLRTTLRSGDPNADQNLDAPGGNATAMMRRGKHSSSKGMSMASLSQLLTNPSSMGEMIAPSHPLTALKRNSYSGATPRSSQGALPSHDNSQQSLYVEVDDEALEITPSPKVRASEYWPTTGAMTWPHPEWPDLVSLVIDDKRSLLQRMPVKEEDVPLVFGSPFTFRDTAQRPTSKRGLFSGGEHAITSHESTEEEDPPSLELNATMASVDEMSEEVGGPVLASPQSTQLRVPSAYHIIRLNERMWMTVVVRGEEEKWHRRTRGLSDDEIRHFLSDMASKLSIDLLFSMSAVVSSRDALQRLDLPAIANAINLGTLGGGSGWKDPERVLSNLKNTFGMKPSSPLLAPLKSPYVRKDSNILRRSRSRGGGSYERPPSFANTDNAAFAFFLGTELSHCLLRA